MNIIIPVQREEINDDDPWENLRVLNFAKQLYKESEMFRSLFKLKSECGRSYIVMQV